MLGLQISYGTRVIKMSIVFIIYFLPSVCRALGTELSHLILYGEIIYHAFYFVYEVELTCLSLHFYLSDRLGNEPRSG